MVWLPRGELNTYQINNIKRDLTIQPRKTTDIQTKEDPSPIFLFEEDEDRGMIGVPRHYYLERKTGDNEEVLDVSYGRPMQDLRTTFKAEGPYKEQADVLKDLSLALEDRAWGGVLLKAAPGFGKTMVILEFARRIGRKTLILVHKDFLVRQWKKRLLQLMPDARIGIIQQKKCEFDELESNGEEPDFVIGLLQSLSRDDGFKYPDRMYSAFGTIISDECVEGDALINTNKGMVSLRSIVDNPSTKVLSFDGSGWSYRKVVRGWKKGNRRTVEIQTQSGRRLRVTPEHLIRSEKGWVRADALRRGMRIVCPVAVDAVNSFRPKTEREGHVGLSWGIRSFRRELTMTPVHSKLIPRPLCASVDVARDCQLTEIRCDQNGFSVGGGVLTLRGTTREKRLSIYQKSKKSLFSEHFSAIRALAIPMRKRKAHGLALTMGQNKSSGQGAKPSDFQPCVSALNLSRTADMGQSASVGRRFVTRSLFRSLSLSNVTARNVSRENGLMRSRMNRSLGGTWTMGISDVAMLSNCTRKDIPLNKFKSPFLGFVLAGMNVKRRKQKENIGSLFSDPNLPAALLNHSPGMCAQEWNTSFDLIDQVSLSDPVDVFDIEVEGNHCFVANGILVHNCHRVGAGTWAGIIPRFRAAWRLGVTATPRRKDGAQDVFFRHISPITYSAQTEMMRPKIRQVFTTAILKPISRGNYQVSTSNLNSAQVLNQLAADRFRTRHIIDDVVKGVAVGRKIIIVSERLEHLREMAALLGGILFGMDLPFAPTIDFYTGDWFTGEAWTETKRNKKGKLLHRKGELKTKKRTEAELEKAESANVIFATKQMVEEALDIPPLDVLVMAMPMGDVEQIVGRSQRWCLPEKEKCETLCPWRAGKCKGKPQPIVVDVVDEMIPKLNAKHRKRLRFYKKLGSL